MFQTPESSANCAQIEYWNGAAGHTWAQFQEQLDRELEPSGAAAMRSLALKPGERVVDIGCGCGHTSRELAARVGGGGSVVGVDISMPMLEVARRTPLPTPSLRLDFRQIDAQTGDLGQAAFDVAFSRFGVMFFSNPVAAFLNIRKSLKPGGRLGFVCWRPLRENPWMHAPLEAAIPLLPPLPVSDPIAPGPFTLSETTRVRAILNDAGFTSVAIEPFDTHVGGADLEQTLALIYKVGPLGAVLREHPEYAETVADDVRSRVRDFMTPTGVQMPAAVWIVTAQNG